MKKNTLFFLPVFFLLLASCNAGNNSGGEERQPLGKPVISVNANKDGLTWAAVQGALSYDVSVNGGATSSVTTPGYAFSSAVGQYTVSVVAVADDAKYNSEAASYAYSTANTALGNLSEADGVITWASLAGTGLEVKKGDGAFAAVTGTSYTAPESGRYTFHAKAGFDETNKIFYVESSDGTKSIDVQLRTPLAAPVLTVAGNGLTWEAIEGAVSYQIKVNDGEPTSVTAPGYTFATEPGSYEVSVVAVADVAKYNSEAATFAYQTVATAINGLTTNYEVVNWTSFVGLGLEVKKGDGAFADVTGSSYTAPEDGNYTLHAKTGFDATNKKFYVEGTNGTKQIDVAYRKPLAAPTLVVNADKNGLTWAAVEGAVSYQVTVGENTETVNEPGYLFETTPGTYKVEVIAKADVAAYNSAKAEFSYTVANSSLGALTLNAGALTWASAVGLGIESKVGAGEFVKVEGNSVLATEAGEYTIRSKAGLDEENHIFYVHNKDVLDQRTVLIAQPAADIVTIEDGSEDTSADLRDRYHISKYGTNGWEDTDAPELTLDPTSADYVGMNPNSVKIKYFKHSANFRFELVDNTVFDGACNVATFTIKGNTDGQFKLLLKVTKDTYIGSVNLKGVFMTYTLNFPAEWTRYYLDMSTANWVINYANQDLTFAYIKAALAEAGVTVDNLADLLPYFDTVGFMCYCTADSNWSAAYAYLDDVAFGYVADTSGMPDHQDFYRRVDLQDNYLFKSDASSGKLTKVSESYVLAVDGVGNLPVTVAKNEANQQVTITSETPSYDFVATLKSSDGGANLTLASAATGTLAPMMSNLKVSSYFVLNDFESYAGTGTGVDKNHTDPAAKSGLRGDFYSDYYGGGSTSPVGGSGWDLMGSNDYLELNTDAGNVHSGTKSARFKYNKSNQMRFISYGLADGTATALPKGSTLSLWTKGVSTRANKLHVMAFFVNQVTPANQETCFTLEEVTIPQGNGWVEVKVTLDPTKTYYGFGIKPVKNNGDGAYFYVDDVMIYNDITPWPSVSLSSNYAFSAASGLKGRIDNVGDNNWKLKFKYGGNPVELPVTSEILDSETARFTSTTTGYDFVATMTTDDEFETLTLSSATGSASALLTGMSAETYHIVEDFESYSATGVGKDGSHGEDERSGLRAEYYAEYYSGGWNLMGTDNYLNLHTTAANVRNGAKSGEFKYRSDMDMRYFTYGLRSANVNAKALPTAEHMSFWVQGLSERANVVKIRVYYVANVSDATANCTELQVTVPQDTDWHEIVINLDTTKTYYGFCIQSIKGNGTSGFYYVDDICLYNTLSPWAESTI